MYSGEKLNSITHWVGAALALIGFGALRTLRIQQHNACFIIRSMISSSVIPDCPAGIDELIITRRIIPTTSIDNPPPRIFLSIKTTLIQVSLNLIIY